MLVDGSIDPDCGGKGTQLRDDDFLVLINGLWEPLDFTMPAEVPACCWQIVCDTFDPTRIGDVEQHLKVGPRSLVICTSRADGSLPETGSR